MRAIIVGILGTLTVGCSHVTWFQNGGLVGIDATRKPVYSTVWGTVNHRIESAFGQAVQNHDWLATEGKGNYGGRVSSSPLHARTEQDFSYTMTPQGADMKSKSLTNEELTAVSKKLLEQAHGIIAAAGGRELEIEDYCTDKTHSFVVKYSSDGATGTISGAVRRASQRPDEPVLRLELHIKENAAPLVE